MQCPRCQADNREGRRFCAECGASLSLTCPSCRFSNEPSEKFCGGCGQALKAAAAPESPTKFSSIQSYTPKHLAEKILTSKSVLEGERKQVTVLFADLKGSMELLADRDPEEARKLLDPVLEHMMEAVHRYEGTVNQVMGDGIMALFGAPLAYEDHAVRACYAALAMQSAIRRYTEQVRGSHGIEVEIRVGLNSGEVVVRAIGGDLRMDYTAVGQTTHLAARMEQLAPPGGIWLTAQTLNLAEERGLELGKVTSMLFWFPQIASALGSAYALSGRVSEALPLLEQAVEGRRVAQAPRVANLSEGYLLVGRMEDASQSTQRALALSRDHKERGNEAWVLRLLGEIASHQDPAEVDKAEAYYHQAMVLAEELGMRPLMARCHLGLGSLYRRIGNLQQARKHLVTATTMMRDMEMGLWLEKAEAELKELV